MDIYIEANGRFEWREVKHDLCNGQGCRGCGDTGEELVRVGVTAG